MKHVIQAARLQNLSRMTFIGIPAIIFVGTFLLNLAIFFVIPGDGPKYSGAVQAVIWYLTGVGVQAMSLNFPFSQAMSITRKHFYLGTLLVAGITTASVALLFTVMAGLEEATGGWWRNGVMFRIPGIWSQGPVIAFLIWFVLSSLLFLLGFLGATVYRRWGVTALVSASLVLGLVLVGAVFLITKLEAWGSIWTWFANTSALGLALYGLAAVVVLAALIYLPLRRATP
ncbi:hypothetical protein [Microbacterium gorillae]|uniref:hypothetical protein n=1 Tax=Microbacterium gorillae TaxID=1231063 RepID=UPI0005902077|nr:hypothetical protein [Microbacterium gorillae]